MLKAMFLVAAILSADGEVIGESRLGPVTPEQCEKMLLGLKSGERRDGQVSYSDFKCVPAEEVE